MNLTSSATAAARGLVEPMHGQNVGEAERAVSVLGGATLAIYGLSRGTLGGMGLAVIGSALIHRGITGYCAVSEALGIDTAHHNPATVVPAQHGAKAECSVTIRRSADELYDWWRNLSNLSKVIPNLESVRETGGTQSHWVARGPMGAAVEWDADIFAERRGEMLAWRSLEGSQIDTTGSVHFRPRLGGQETEVTVSLKYVPPAGKLGVVAAKWMGDDPEASLREGLTRLKQLMEKGESAAVGR